MTRNDDITSQNTRSESRVSSEGSEAREEEKKPPMYMFTPVDRYGDNKEETKPLQDLGRKYSLCCFETSMHCSRKINVCDMYM